MYLRKEWNDHKTHQKLFGDKIKSDNYWVKELKRKLALLPQTGVYYTIAAYGSLMNTEDIPRTLGDDAISYGGTLSGFRRIFDVGDASTGSYLNIKQTNNPDDEIIVNLITVKADMMPAYISREGLYEPMIVECKDFEGNELSAITVMSDVNEPGLQPMLNYVHLCVSGVKSLYGFDGVECMLDNTDVYSINNCRYVSLREWLNRVDLVNHMIQQTYRSR